MVSVGAGRRLGVLWTLGVVSLVAGAKPCAAQGTAPPAITVAGASRPAAGEVALEGVVRATISPAEATSRQFTLAVTSVTTPDEHIQTLSPAHPKTALVGEGSPIFLATGDAASPASADELRPGAKVRCLGANSGEGKPMVARLIVVLTTADAASAATVAGQVKVGENLLPTTADTNAYTLFQNSPEVHGTVTADGNALKISVDKVSKDDPNRSNTR